MYAHIEVPYACPSRTARAVQLIGSDLESEDEDEDEDEDEPANKVSERFGVKVVQRAYMGC